MNQLLNEDKELLTGTIVGDTGRMVILCHKLYDRVPGDSYATWIAICSKPGEYHPYAVWNVIARPEGFVAENGNYCFTIKEAIEAYERRGGQ